MAKKVKKTGASTRSRKRPVIERIFNERWDPATASLTNPLVTLEEVQRAIEEHNQVSPDAWLSPGNPANFFKDFVRVRRSANRHWPKSVWERGYTAVQRTGENACFEFVPVLQGQTEPFPDRVPPSLDPPRLRIETLSLPLASRRLGRSDETWLTQVMVRLRLIETHLALVSRRHFVQLDHLQMGIKQRRTEIDAVFLAHESVDDQIAPREVLVCCEAKVKDDILMSQMVAQVKAMFQISVTQQHVLPIAAKIAEKSLIRIVEFDIISRDEAEQLTTLAPVSEALYELVPPVPGIGLKVSRRRASEEGRLPP